MRESYAHGRSTSSGPRNHVSRRQEETAGRAPSFDRAGLRCARQRLLKRLAHRARPRVRSALASATPPKNLGRFPLVRFAGARILELFTRLTELCLGGCSWGIERLLREMGYAWSLLTTDFGRMRVKRRSRFGAS